jgi:hypothetical protein
MILTLPELSLVVLVVLVGVSGSGKSTFARRHFKATEILSSDVCRVARGPSACPNGAAFSSPTLPHSGYVGSASATARQPQRGCARRPSNNKQAATPFGVEALSGPRSQGWPVAPTLGYRAEHLWRWSEPVPTHPPFKNRPGRVDVVRRHFLQTTA